MYTLSKSAILQNQLANYCRNGKTINLPGARNEKLHHYRRLVFNVVKGIMDDAYPITHQVFGEKVWHEIVEEFHAAHDCKTPQAWKLPRELLIYTNENNLGKRLKKPWLNNLMLLEWIEIEIYMMPDIKQEEYDFFRFSEAYSRSFIFNTEHIIIELEYPVHLTYAEDTEDKKGRYYVLVFREPDTGRVQFIDLNPFIHQVLKALISGSTLDEWWQASGIGLKLKAPEKDIKKAAGIFLKSLHEKKFLLGFRKL